jgi:putative transposase
MWNLPPPPGFQGLHPDQPITVYQRHLPHWRQDGATYFVTFRLADSLPQSKLDELAALKEAWERQHPRQRPPSGTALLSRRATVQESRPTDELAHQLRQHPPSGTALPSRRATVQESRPTDELARQLQERIERWLDQGMGSCPLKQPSLAAFLTSAMHRFDDDRYELDCYVVLPNHAHVIVRPLMPTTHPIEAIVGSWKKYSSRRINRALQQTGDLWQDESYDRLVRDEEHLWRAIQYIGANPDKAGLARESCPMWIRPQWVEFGWRFDGPGLGPTARESRPT